jgi:hypothetical protein
MKNTTVPYKQLLWLVLAIIVSGATLAKAQQVTFVNPTDNQTGVILRPTLRITTDYPIDPSSITDYFVRADGVDAEFGDAQTLMLLDKATSLEVQSANWKLISWRGTYTQVNSTTLDFEVYDELDPDTEYILKLGTLKVINGLDTLPVPVADIDFKTMPAAHFVENFPYNHGDQVLCNEVFHADFNVDLDATITPLGDIIELHKLDSIVVVGDSIVKYTSPRPGQIWLDPADNSIIRFTPDYPYEPNEEVIFKVFGSYISGNPYDDKEADISIKSQYRITMSVGSDTPGMDAPQETVYPFVGESSFNYDNKLRIFADRIVGDMIFVRWDCMQNEELNNRQKPYIDIDYDCGTLQDLTLKAVYKLIDTVTLDLMGMPEFTYSVYSEDKTYLGGQGIYNIAPGEKVFVEVEDTDPFVFEGWTSTENHLNSPQDGQEFDKGKKDNEVLYFNPMYAKTRMQVDNFGRNIGLGGFGGPYTPAEKDYGLNFATYLVWGADDKESEENAPFESDLIEIFVDGQKLTKPTFSSGNTKDTVQVKMRFNPNTPRCETGAGFHFREIWFDGTNIIFTYPYPDSIIFDIPTDAAFDEVYAIVSPYGVYKTLTFDADWHPNHDYGSGLIGQDVSVRADVLLNDMIIESSMIRLNRQLISVEDLFCRQIVRLTPLTDITGGGYYFMNWKDDDPSYWYELPSSAPIATVEMNTNKRMNGILGQNFRVEEIAFYHDTDRDDVEIFPSAITRTPTWQAIDPLYNEGMLVNEIDVFRYYGNNDGYETTVLFRFNNPVSLADIYNKISVRNLSAAIDRDGTTRSKTIYKLNQTNSGYYIPTGNPGDEDDGISENEIFFRLKTASKAIPRGQNFALEIHEDINNSRMTEDPILTNTGAIDGYTETPPTFVQLNYVKSTCDPDGWFDSEMECFIPHAGALLGYHVEQYPLAKGDWVFNTIPNSSYDSQYGEWDIEEGQTKRGPWKIYETSGTKSTDLLTMYCEYYDADQWGGTPDYSGRAASVVASCNNEIKEEVNTKLADEISKNYDWDEFVDYLYWGSVGLTGASALVGAAAIAGLISLGPVGWVLLILVAIGALIAWLISGFKPDFLRGNYYVKGWENWFGAKDMTAGYNKGSGVKVEMETKLKKFEEPVSTSEGVNRNNGDLFYND